MKKIGVALALALIGASAQGMSIVRTYKKFQEKRAVQQGFDPEQMAQEIKHELIARAESFREEFLRLEQMEESTQQAITKWASAGDAIRECSERSALSSYRCQKKRLEDDFYKEFDLDNTMYLIRSGIEMDPAKRTGEQWFNDLGLVEIVMLAQGLGYKKTQTNLLKKEHFKQVVL